MNLINSLPISKNFFVESLRFSMKTIMHLWIEFYFFFSNLYGFYFFFLSFCSFQNFQFYAEGARADIPALLLIVGGKYSVWLGGYFGLCLMKGVSGVSSMYSRISILKGSHTYTPLVILMSR